MAGKSTISISFKVEDAQGGLKDVVLEAKNLQKIMQSNVVEAEKLKGQFINFASIAPTID